MPKIRVAAEAHCAGLPAVVHESTGVSRMGFRVPATSSRYSWKVAPATGRFVVASSLAIASDERARLSVTVSPATGVPVCVASIVYAAEWPDNPDGHVRNLVLADDVALTSEFRASMLNGVAVVRGTSKSLSLDATGKIVSKTQPFVAIPYYAWANRGRGEMMVWMPRTDASASPRPWPTLAMSSKVTTSRQSHLSETMINDGEEPVRSSAGGSASSGMIGAVPATHACGPMRTTRE